MKKFKAILFFLVGCFFTSCFTSTVDIKQYTIKGHLINVNNPLKFAGMRMYLESQSYSIGQGTVIKTIAETIVSDSGRFTLVYDSNPTTGVTIKCQEMNNFSAHVSSNLNMSPNFYLADSLTILFTFNSANPLTPIDTLFFKYEIINKEQKTLKIIGPILNGHNIKIRSLIGGLRTSWGRGFNDFNQYGDNRYKSFHIKGDPFVDSVTIKY